MDYDKCKGSVETLCNQIIAAANSVYVKGCDDIAMSNYAQLRGICVSANQIKEIYKKGERNDA